MGPAPGRLPAPGRPNAAPAGACVTASPISLTSPLDAYFRARKRYPTSNQGLVHVRTIIIVRVLK